MIPNLPLTNYLSVISWFSASWRFGCAWGWLGACVLLVASICPVEVQWRSSRDPVVAK